MFTRPNVSCECADHGHSNPRTRPGEGLAVESKKTPTKEQTTSTHSAIADVVRSFEVNVTAVKKLLHFDRDVITAALANVEALQKQLQTAGQQYFARSAENTVALLKNVKNNDSLQGRYKIINNQAVVLLVSYFGSAVEDLFKIGVDSRLTLDPDHSALMDEELKLSFSDIRARGWDLKAIAADLLVDKKDLKFQDMKSIADVFRSYLGITIKRDQTVNNIITAQACRHVIVHAGNEVTTKMMHQLRDASPRDLKAQITVGEIVEFSPEEVALVAASMQTYISNLCAGLKGRV